MAAGVNKQVDVSRLMADLAAARVELLSAQCATDRLRLQYSPENIAAHGESKALLEMMASAEAVYRFFSQFEGLRHHEKGAPSKSR